MTPLRSSRIHAAFGVMPAVLALALALCGADGRAASVANGPMIGALTPTNVTVWLRLDQAAHARLRYERVAKPGFVEVDGGDALDANDRTLKVSVGALTPGALYRYEIGVTQAGGAVTWSAPAWFRTPKKVLASSSFAVVTDFVDGGKASAALASATATRPGFLAVLGDMDHRGPAVDPSTGTWYLPGQSDIVLGNMRSMHRMMRDPTTPIGAQMVSGLVASTQDRPQTLLVETWDDHDYCGNNADATCPFRAQALQAWRDYFAWAPDGGLGNAGGCAQEGVYQRVMQGDIATVLLLDARSGRVPAGGASAPTILGACQLDWLIRRLKAATTVWKFILSPDPFNPGTKPYDAWGAFDDGPASDRERLLAAIRDNDIRNVVVLSGDIHSGGAIDDGTHSGLPEVSVPHANMPAGMGNTYCRKQGGVVDSFPGTWTLGGLTDPNIGQSPPHCLRDTYPAGTPVGSLPPPPYPLDGRGAPGFVRVDLTHTSAAIQVLDAAGQPRMGWRADGTSAVMRLDLVAR